MNQEEKLYKEFEKEAWLFLDGGLPKDRIEFWQQKFSEYPKLEEYLTDYKEVSDIYEDSEQLNIDDDKFNLMIDNAVYNNSLLQKVKDYFSNIFSTNPNFVFGKIAFASLLIIAAVIISVLTDKPNSVTRLTQKVNNTVLDWDANFVESQINKVGVLLKVTKDDDYRKYYKYKVISRDVDKNIKLVNTSLEDLKEKIINEEL